VPERRRRCKVSVSQTPMSKSPTRLPTWALEVNDNPDIEHGIEDAVGKDEVWIRVLRWFINRLEK
jgi:hypothetical protein